MDTSITNEKNKLHHYNSGKKYVIYPKYKHQDYIKKINYRGKMPINLSFNIYKYRRGIEQNTL